MIKYLCLIIMSTPVQIDQGILSILNSNLPGCELNSNLAQWHTSTDNAKSIPKGTPCPNGYTAVPAQSYISSNETYQMCAKDWANDSVRPKIPQSFVEGVAVCQMRGLPPFPAKTVNWFPIILIISIIVLILGALALYFMNKTSPIIRSAPT